MAGPIATACAYVWISALCAESALQPPREAAGQRQSAENVRGSEDAPVFVQVLESEKSKDERAREDEKESRRAAAEVVKSSLDEKLVEFTGDLALYTKLLAVATALLFFATGGLVWIGYRQTQDARRSIGASEKSARAAKKSAAVAETAMAITQRAFIFVGREMPRIFGLESRTLKLRVQFENSGPTPARAICFCVNSKCFDSELREDFEFRDIVEPDFAASTLAANGVFDTEEFSFEEAEIITLSWSRRAYVWGWIEYNDILPNTERHRTEFCYRLVMHGEFGSANFRMTKHSHHRYNGADGDCMYPATNFPKRAGLSRPP